MQSQRVVFDRIIELHRRAIKGSRWTEFSFEHAGRKHYAVRVPGHPSIRAGQAVTVVLRRPDDWQTLAGWVDQSTGQIIGQPIFSLYFYSLVCLVFGIAFLAAIEDHFHIQLMGALIGVCFLLSSPVLAFEAYRRAAVRRVLVRIRDAASR